MDVAEQDAILRTHIITPAFLRADDFQSFYEARKIALITCVERAMGKNAVAHAMQPAPEDDWEEDDPEEESG